MVVIFGRLLSKRKKQRGDFVFVLFCFCAMDDFCICMAKKAIELGDGRSAIKGGSSILTVESSAFAPEGSPGKKALVDVKTNDTTVTNNKWANWGDGDDWPLVMSEKMAKISVMNRALSLSGDLHYGAGIQWCRFNEETKKHEPLYLADWHRFTRQIHFNFDKEFGNAIDALQTWFWSAVEIILEDNTNRVFSVRALDPTFCRLGKRVKGKITKLYYSMDFGDGASTEDAEPIDVFDPLKPFAKKKFVVLLSYKTFGRNYYPDPYWNSTFLNGWADVAIEVPKLIKYIYKNQITVKYHIHYPESAIRMECKEWDEMSTEKRIEWLQSKQESIEGSLVGGEMAGKSVISTYQVKEDLVEIKPISNLLENKNDLPNNVAANSEILFSIGLDPALVGLNMPGGKDLNGSGGSDKRMGMLISQSTLYRERAVSLFLPRLIGFFNGYDKDVYPMFKDIDVSKTTDVVPSGKTEEIK